jgi:predicted DNA-binding transcriptional regulator YafY
MAKVAAATRRPSGASDVILPSASADEAPEAQGAAVARLTTAIADRKRVSFRYVDAKGGSSAREVEPWGLFARDGRWYLVAFDTAAAGVRTFAAPRMTDLAVAPRPKTPDFEPPTDFSVADYMVMPFQYGKDSVEALVELTGPAAGRAAALTAGRGILGRAGDAVLWRVPVSSTELFARWVVENGPGIRVREPRALADAVRTGLARVVALHG